MAKTVLAKNGSGGVSKVHVEIPALKRTEIKLLLVGDRPLLINNKSSQLVIELDKRYKRGGKTKSIVEDAKTDDEMYAMAFYVCKGSKFQPPNPKGSYGIPISGIKKCVNAAIRLTGITDNTTVGLIQRSFFILSDGDYLAPIKFKKLERDVRPVNIGSGAKTVPQMRHRPMFHDWSVEIRVQYNDRVLSPEQIVNLFMYAGQYVGLCEMRAQKSQGECGGFIVKHSS